MAEYKPVSFSIDQWERLRESADALSHERGTRISLASYVSEAIKFFEENRIKKSEGAPL